MGGKRSEIPAAGSSSSTAAGSLMARKITDGFNSLAAQGLAHLPKELAALAADLDIKLPAESPF